MRFVAMNALAIVSVIAACAMAYTGHDYFGVALIVLAFLSAHTLKGSEE